jgi:hypothetical protein
MIKRKLWQYHHWGLVKIADHTLPLTKFWNQKLILKNRFKVCLFDSNQVWHLGAPNVSLETVFKVLMQKEYIPWKCYGSVSEWIRKFRSKIQIRIRIRNKVRMRIRIQMLLLNNFFKIVDQRLKNRQKHIFLSQNFFCRTGPNNYKHFLK